MAILEFQGENRFLSNFWIEPDGTHVEGEYQARKCARLSDVERFYRLSPGQAKRLGRTVDMRPDWEDCKVEIMRALVRQKFMDHPSLLAKLVATGDQELVEGNKWGDHIWGVCAGRGANHLGKILMWVRNVASGLDTPPSRVI